MVARVICYFLIAFPTAALALDSWDCTYPGFGPERKKVTVNFRIEGNKLVSGKYAVPKYDLLENNQYGIVGSDHNSKFDEMKGAVRVFSSTVIIDKTFGKFIYLVGEIGDEPGVTTGQCVRN